MNFVKHHKQYGVEAKEIPCLTGQGEPTTETEGAVGCLYMDIGSGDLYKCVAVLDNEYVWKVAASNTSGGGESDGGGASTGVVVDLLWENLDIAEQSIQSRGDFDVELPTMSEYDKIEIVHMTDDSTPMSNWFDVDLFENWSGTLCCPYDNSFRDFWVDIGRNLIMFSGEDSPVACVPIRIYGIKLNGHLAKADKDEIANEVVEQLAPVSYKPQTLTEEEKAQARINIGASSENAKEMFGVTITEGDIKDKCFVDPNGAEVISSYVSTNYLPLNGWLDTVEVRCTIIGNASLVVFDSGYNVLMYINGNNAADYGLSGKMDLQTFSFALPTGAAYIRLSAHSTVYTKPSDFVVQYSRSAKLTETLSKAILVTPQNLTEEQKAQVRANIGVSADGGSSGGSNVASGSYDGTGAYGYSNDNRLTLPFAPKLIMFTGTKVEELEWDERDEEYRPIGYTYRHGPNSANTLMINCDMLTTEYTYNSATSTYLKKSSDGKTIYWYCLTSASGQLNSGDTVYYWFAIG